MKYGEKVQERINQIGFIDCNLKDLMGKQITFTGSGEWFGQCSSIIRSVYLDEKQEKLELSIDPVIYGADSIIRSFYCTVTSGVWRFTSYSMLRSDVSNIINGSVKKTE